MSDAMSTDDIDQPENEQTAQLAGETPAVWHDVLSQMVAAMRAYEMDVAGEADAPNHHKQMIERAEALIASVHRHNAEEEGGSIPLKPCEYVGAIVRVGLEHSISVEWATQAVCKEVRQQDVDEVFARVLTGKPPGRYAVVFQDERMHHDIEMMDAGELIPLADHAVPLAEAADGLRPLPSIPQGFSYVKVTTPGAHGCINLFWGDYPIALVPPQPAASIRNALDAQPQSDWVACSERFPVAEDADFQDFVFFDDGNEIRYVHIWEVREPQHKRSPLARISHEEEGRSGLKC